MRMQTKLEIERRELAARFWHMVRQSRDPDACWEWKGCKTKNGHGMWHSHHNVSPMLSHRVAWELTYGEIPARMCIKHTCHNPSCCRPMHLRGCHPSDLGHRKLDETQVVKMLAMLSSGVSQRKTAAAFGISLGAVAGIAVGINWRTVPRPANMHPIRRPPDGYPGPKALRPRPALCG